MLFFLTQMEHVGEEAALPVSSRGRPSARVCVLTSSYEDPSQTGQGPLLLPSSHLSHLFKDPISTS